jgi:hypothetical protein
LITNYHVYGQTALDDDVLNTLGLTGFESGGVGLVALHDSRDVQDKPSKGWLLNFNNVAYREAISGDNNFDVLPSRLPAFLVARRRQCHRGPAEQPMDGGRCPRAPTLRYMLRGYTIGEYLGQNMSSLEVEERYKIAAPGPPRSLPRVPVSTGDGKTCESDNLYPTYGARYSVLAQAPTGDQWPISEYAEGQGRQQCRHLQNGGMRGDRRRAR